MSKVVVGMTISLDGFVNDRSGSVAALYSDFESFRDFEPMQEAIQKTGAVVMGKHAFAMAEDPDLYADNYEFQVPIFVVTHEIPNKQPKETDKLSAHLESMWLTRIPPVETGGCHEKPA